MIHRTLLTLAFLVLVPALPGASTKPVDRVMCNSFDGTYYECRVSSAGKIELVSELSEQRCFEGTTWGTRAPGLVWVDRGCRGVFRIQAPDSREKATKVTLRTVACESNGSRTHCAAETTHGVAIAKRTSEAACVLDESWGFDDDGVWVDRGCGARFALGGFRLPPDAIPPTAVRITCESINDRETECPIPIARGVGLIRDVGRTNCVLNRNWGYHAEGIWVSDGCRAEFAVAR